MDAEYTCSSNEVSAILTKRVGVDRLCRMVIYLYSSAERAIVVEIIKLKGDNLLFHQECKIILKAAKGIILDDSVSDRKPSLRGGMKRKTCCTLSMTSSIARPVTPLTPEKVARDNTNNCCNFRMDEGLISNLEKVEELMKKDRVDARFIGWKTLCAMTDLASASTTNAFHTSQVVLGISEDLGTSMDIHELLLCVLLRDSNCGDENDDDVEIQFEKKIRIVALQILHNAFRTLSSLRQLKMLDLFDMSSKDELWSALSRDITTNRSELEVHISSLCLSFLDGINNDIAISMPPTMTPRTRLRRTYHRDHSLLLSKS
jgi:hypothetical protein